MKKLIIATALLAASSAASAWNGPFFSDHSGDGFGDGNFAFNMSANARSTTHARGYGHDYYGYGPYAYGPYAYAPYGAPVAPYGAPAPYAAPQAPQAPVADK